MKELELKLHDLFKSACDEKTKLELEKLIYQFPIIPTKFTDMELIAICERIEQWMQPERTHEIWHEYIKIYQYATICGLTRDAGHQDMLKIIGSLVSDNAVKWVNRNADFFGANDKSEKVKFMNHAKHMVTIFLFQPPAVYSKTPLEREIRDKIFSSWNPNWYVVDFCEKLNVVFKNL